MFPLGPVEYVGILVLILGSWVVSEALRDPRRSFSRILVSAFRPHRNRRHSHGDHRHRGYRRIVRFLAVLGVGLLVLTALAYVLRTMDKPDGTAGNENDLIENRPSHRH